MQTGPVAAAAWEAAHEQMAAPRSPARGRHRGDLRAAHPVAADAVRAHLGLEVLGRVAAAMAALQAGRLLAVLLVDDLADLAGSRAYTALADLAATAGALTAAAAMVSAVLLAGWAAAATSNLGALDLDGHRWSHRLAVVVERVVLTAGLAAAWLIAPGGFERADRAVELALATATGAAAVVASGRLRRLLVSVTSAEVQRAELLARIDLAARERPRGRVPLHHHHHEPAT